MYLGPEDQIWLAANDELCNLATFFQMGSPGSLRFDRTRGRE